MVDGDLQHTSGAQTLSYRFRIHTINARTHICTHCAHPLTQRRHAKSLRDHLCLAETHATPYQPHTHTGTDSNLIPITKWIGPPLAELARSAMEESRAASNASKNEASGDSSENSGGAANDLASQPPAYKEVLQKDAQDSNRKDAQESCVNPSLINLSPYFCN